MKKIILFFFLTLPTFSKAQDSISEKKFIKDISFCLYAGGLVNSRLDKTGEEPMADYIFQPALFIEARGLYHNLMYDVKNNSIGALVERPYEGYNLYMFFSKSFDLPDKYISAGVEINQLEKKNLEGFSFLELGTDFNGLYFNLGFYFIISTPNLLKSKPQTPHG